MVLLIGQERPHDPHLTIEIDNSARDSGTAVAMLCLYPQLDFLRDTDVITETIFLVDRRYHEEVILSH